MRVNPLHLAPLGMTWGCDRGVRGDHSHHSKSVASWFKMSAHPIINIRVQIPTPMSSRAQRGISLLRDGLTGGRGMFRLVVVPVAVEDGFLVFSGESDAALEHFRPDARQRLTFALFTA